MGKKVNFLIKKIILKGRHPLNQPPPPHELAYTLWLLCKLARSKWCPSRGLLVSREIQLTCLSGGRDIQSALLGVWWGRMSRC